MNKRFVITGPPGGGKTPVLRELVAMGFIGVPEPAREVLAEQRSLGVRGQIDRSLFCELMLVRAVESFERLSSADAPAFFDRGIPDLIGYARWLGTDPSAARRAAAAHRYNELVFFFPSWPEIYTTDDERTMTCEMAEAMGNAIRDAYIELGYTLVEVPRDTPEARARFIEATVGGS